MLNPQLLCVSFLLNLKKGRQVWIWLGALSQLKPALVEKPIYGILRKKEKKKKKNTTTLKNFWFIPSSFWNGCYSGVFWQLMTFILNFGPRKTNFLPKRGGRFFMLKMVVNSIDLIAHSILLTFLLKFL